MTTKRWIMVIDDEVELHASRAAARKSAAWHRHHPANADIRQHGPYRNVDGVPRVLDRLGADGRLSSVAETLE